jgi:hypothetical protein
MLPNASITLETLFSLSSTSQISNLQIAVKTAGLIRDRYSQSLQKFFRGINGGLPFHAKMFECEATTSALQHQIVFHLAHVHARIINAKISFIEGWSRVIQNSSGIVIQFPVIKNPQYASLLLLRKFSYHKQCSVDVQAVQPISEEETVEKCEIYDELITNAKESASRSGVLNGCHTVEISAVPYMSLSVDEFESEGDMANRTIPRFKTWATDGYFGGRVKRQRTDKK